MIASLADTASENLKKIELQLSRLKDEQQRMVLLDQLAEYYAFTDCAKAQRYLAELKKILIVKSNADYQFSYHNNMAFVENQLYNFYLAEEHYQKAIAILEDIGTVKQQAEAYIDYAGTLINLRNFEEANKWLEKAKTLLVDFPDASLESRIICREGSINLIYRNYPEAIEQFLESDKQINALVSPLTVKDYYFKTIIHSSLGKIYEDSEEHERSVKAYLNVINWCETLGMRTRLSWHYLNVGNGYMALHEPENAELYFKKSLKIKDDMSQDARAAAYANLGSCYLSKELYKEALLLIKKAESLYREKSDTDYANFAELESRKAKIAVAEKKWKKAEKHMKKAYENAWLAKDYKRLSAICQEIATYYADQENYEDAYDYLVLHGQMEEQRIAEMNRRLIMEMEVKYEADKKRQEAEVLKLQAVGLQLKALRAQMNPHFIYNALNAIQNYITSNDLSSATKYLAIFARLMRQSLELSDMEYIPLEDELEFLENYLFINQQLRFESKLDYDIQVDDEIEDDIMGLPAMIVQPYVENALEHGLRSISNGKLTIEFILIDDDTIQCIVQDNGVGREKAKTFKEDNPQPSGHRSMGTAITEKRLDIIAKSKHNKEMFVKTIDLFSEQGEATGTRVEILIPIVIIQK
ncbi:MAG: histidine kinase [Saprospiraceae bacterium]